MLESQKQLTPLQIDKIEHLLSFNDLIELPIDILSHTMTFLDMKDVSKCNHNMTHDNNKQLIHIQSLPSLKELGIILNYYDHDHRADQDKMKIIESLQHAPIISRLENLCISDSFIGLQVIMSHQCSLKVLHIR